MAWLSLLFTVALFSNASAKSFDAVTKRPVFNTEYGMMLGKTVGESDVFLGVPFAKPPVGELRFKDPEPLQRSKEKQIETTTLRPDCMQSLPQGQGETDEDCLYLNIFKPSKQTTENLPVLVFFPGGNFMTGGCFTKTYDATILAPNINAIVVCANYRLGAFGFLYYEDKRRGQEGDILGNFGIKDQIAALKFIRENIENLGGDINKITISGQSAGAQSVGMHLTSEQDNDLFQQAILMSGPFSISLKSEEEAILLSKLFFKELGCEESDLSCLNKPAGDILKASDNCSLKKYNLTDETSVIKEMVFNLKVYFSSKATHMSQPWGPKVNTTQPITQFKSVEKPVMIGSTSGEGLLLTPPSAGIDILNSSLPDDGETVIDKYRNYTYEDEDIFFHFLTDYLFTCPARSIALNLNSAHVYRYYFDHALSFAEDIPSFQMCGEYACHGEDLPIFFQSASAMDLEFTEDEKKLVEIYSAFLENFIHDGDPGRSSYHVRPELANPNQVLWKPFASYDQQTMVFSTKEPVACKKGIRQEQCDFLDGIGYYDVRVMN